MRIINQEELRIIQMDILKVIDKYCCENGIRYSLACGSCLGAVRHQGYIPWDDDIDIYIPRQDYERFVIAFPERLNDVKLVSMERDSSWNKAYAQAYDCRTVLKEDISNPCKMGVYIDIYPIDQVPDTDAEWVSYNKKRRFLIRMSELKYVKLKRNRSIAKNLILIFGKLLLSPFSARAIAKAINRFAQKNNGRGFRRSFECVQGMLQKRPFDSSLMDEFVRVPFEDCYFMIMKNYDEYLSNGYGDYMTLPPEEKRVSHHSYEAYWKD